MGLEDLRRLRGLIDNLSDDIAGSRAVRTVSNALERNAEDATALNAIARSYRSNGLLDDAGRLTQDGFDQLDDALYQIGRADGMDHAAAQRFASETIGEIEGEGARLMNAGADATADAAEAGARNGADESADGARRGADEVDAPPTRLSSAQAEVVIETATTRMRDAVDSGGTIDVTTTFQGLRRALIDSDSLDAAAHSGKSPRATLQAIEAGEEVSPAELQGLQTHFSRFHRAADSGVDAAQDGGKMAALGRGLMTPFNAVRDLVSAPGRALSRNLSWNGSSGMGTLVNGGVTSILASGTAIVGLNFIPIPANDIENDVLMDQIVVRWNEAFDPEENNRLADAEPGTLQPREAIRAAIVNKMRASSTAAATAQEQTDIENTLRSLERDLQDGAIAAADVDYNQGGYGQNGGARNTITHSTNEITGAIDAALPGNEALSDIFKDLVVEYAGQDNVSTTLSYNEASGLLNSNAFNTALSRLSEDQQVAVTEAITDRNWTP